jgi:hypothetical protein
MGTNSELIHEVKVNHLKDPTNRYAAWSGVVDTRGWASLLFVWHVGVYTGPLIQFTPHVLESDSASSGFTEIDDSQLEIYAGNAKITTTQAKVTSVSTDQREIVFSVIGALKRYIKFSISVYGGDRKWNGTGRFRMPIGGQTEVRSRFVLSSGEDRPADPVYDEEDTTPTAKLFYGVLGLQGHPRSTI